MKIKTRLCNGSFKSKSLHICTLCVCSVVSDSVTPMDCSPPGSSVHGILQAGMLEWVAISSSKGSSWPRDQTCVCCISCLGQARSVRLSQWESPLYKYCDEFCYLNINFKGQIKPSVIERHFCHHCVESSPALWAQAPFLGGREPRRIFSLRGNKKIWAQQDSLLCHVFLECRWFRTQRSNSDGVT